MIDSSQLCRWRLVFLGLLVATALAWSGCGDDDLCTDTSCEFGTCDSQSGECVNPPDCDEANDCIIGYDCGDGGTCEPLEACSVDEDCERGLCVDGACSGYPGCKSDDECIERSFCGPEDVCEPDPCAKVDCARGECKPGTEECVSKESCTEQTELVDCVEGDKCAEGQCLGEDEFCEVIECERGVCDFEVGGCKNADDCKQDDALCLAGYFCNDEDECQESLCDEPCANGADCIPETGECPPPTCDDDDDCVQNHYCDEGTCRLRTCEELNDGQGCLGNRICDFTDDGPRCAEPDQCETSIDCDDGRQCTGRTCIDQLSCTDDALEPNDAADAATDFVSVSSNQTLTAKICQQDADVYAFNTGDVGDPSRRGSLLIELVVPRRDRGLGKLALELSGEDGDTYSADTGEDGRARIDMSYIVTDHGDYTIEVSGVDVEEAGVGYELSVALLPDESVDACADATPIHYGTRISGDTTAGDSTYLGSSCTSELNRSRELVYEYEVERPQEVSVDLTPQMSTVDLSMSWRKSCPFSGTEQACVDAVEAGEEESLVTLLDEGTYYLVVQGGDAGSGGPFEMTLDIIYTACASESHFCEDADTAAECTDDGGRFVSVDCEDGCNPSWGQCTSSSD